MVLAIARRFSAWSEKSQHLQGQALFFGSAKIWNTFIDFFIKFPSFGQKNQVSS
jgi:hypothetical protein